ncbi:DAK2 domain-containing protein [Iocasia frigidifontis]|uniref:DAK2 domain-containing protein n=1 Tax=Iocasia fonsfrigidae TaxID=2682810 RepID=A0A8A7K8T8_9FIRM|nr:DAK2 domain-containing protein [Iocasia fonsfrigidae]QTL98166.1 DAK2 domain-containing protein [Iocasia fonsfrigidae]
MQVNEKVRGFIKTINGDKFKEMLLSSLMWLKEQQSLIDSLNVFPVPDGDTGTNMYLTFLDAVKEVKKIKENDVSKINEALAKGALMGARGNSGVILSQLLRGFSLANKDNKLMDSSHLADSLRKASEIAYQGVLKPVEGTILTVSRKAADGAEMAYKKELDLVAVLENTIAYARDALKKTPQMLPELKEAGVVDAGGQGYLTILEGLLKGLIGQKAYEHKDLELIQATEKKNIKQNLKYTYCTQVLIETNSKRNIKKLRSELEDFGDSLLVVGTDNIIKIHIHTNHPGVILEYGLKIGSLNDIKIDNMRLQSEEKIRQEEKKQKKEFISSQGKGIIAVGQGEGIKKILHDLGVDIIIDGGQSMNPSTNDFLKAIEDINSLELIILPNNKNVISAARQAASLSDKKVEVVPTKSIPQAISSLLVFNEEAVLSDLKDAMITEMENVKTIEITTAVKDSKVNGLEIKTGDVIGLFNHDIKLHGSDYNEVVIGMINEILDDEELLTIYYGEEVSKEEAIALKEQIFNNFDFDEIEIYNGKQPLYPFIISLE